MLNDVLEHLPDLNEAFGSFRDHLKDQGLLVLNAPDRTGIIYRIARLRGSLGVKGPFGRMWQAGLPSPHAWYFTRKNLQQLCGAHGLAVVDHLLG